MRSFLYGPGGKQYTLAGSVHRAVPFVLDPFGASMLTPDSDIGGEGHEDYHVHRVASPLWLPPTSVGKALSTSVWQGEVELALDGFPGNGSWSEAVIAGTRKIFNVFGGVRTDFPTENAPGWLTLADAATHRRHRKPSPDEDEQADLPYLAALSFTAGGEDVGGWALDVGISIYGWRPALHALDLPDSDDPLKWWDHEGLEPCWYFDVQASATAYWGTFPTTSVAAATQLITFHSFDGDHLIGVDNSGDPAGDEAWSISLAASDFFDE